ncbi:Ccr4-not transcription complex subunit [Thalictrum thalictroides]|uniref:poly(A)-specific ribonuclease n=1 Tax=Thalictrum thalictroides TaxID=46969 RepID=A0A7J6VMF1_THATH|nr:Ccr4-not transcription complex subunit [Thalictrum thalictroides]
MTGYFCSPKAMEIEEVIVRSVWDSNLIEEFDEIKKYALLGYRVASFDTEFPGTIYGQYNKRRTPLDSYIHLKANVDATNIIQLGLTLYNGTNFIVWEFNFSDFNLKRGDLHNPVSVQLLKDNGLDFEKNVKDGIKSVDFAVLLASSGLVGNTSNMTWIGFHCAIDYGYMIKILTQEPLPTQLDDFLNLVWKYFGTNIYDLKYMMKYCNGLFGGLNRVADVLEVDRCVGSSHQAGSDSLLTMKTYIKIVPLFFAHLQSEQLYLMFSGLLFGFDDVQIQVAASVPADSCYYAQIAY